MSTKFVPGLGIVTTIEKSGVEKTIPKPEPIDPAKEFGMEFVGDPFFGRLEKAEAPKATPKKAKDVSDDPKSVKEEGDPVDVSDYAEGGPSKPAEQVAGGENKMPDVFRRKSITDEVYIPSLKAVGEVVKSFTREGEQIVIVKAGGLFKEFRPEDLMPIQEKHFGENLHEHTSSEETAVDRAKGKKGSKKQLPSTKESEEDVREESMDELSPASDEESEGTGVEDTTLPTEKETQQLVADMGTHKMTDGGKAKGASKDRLPTERKK